MDVAVATAAPWSDAAAAELALEVTDEAPVPTSAALFDVASENRALPSAIGTAVMTARRVGWIGNPRPRRAMDYQCAPRINAARLMSWALIGPPLGVPAAASSAMDATTNRPEGEV